MDPTTTPTDTSRRRVLVIGARGALGTLVADAFDRAGWSVHPAGRTHLPSARYRHLDLGDPTTVPGTLEDMDVVVSTVPDPTLNAERHVLRHGGLLVNLGAGPAHLLHTLRAAPGEPAGAVLMNAGIAPGVTNLVAAALLEEHPDADEVQLVFTVSAQGSGGPAAGDFAHRGLTGRRHHRTTRVVLPEPFGPRTVLGFAEADRGWLGPHADGVHVSTYICLSERPLAAGMAALNHARLIGHLPRAALGSGTPPSVEAASTEAVAHSVSVLRRGRPQATRLVRGRGDFRMAAASAVVITQELRGQTGNQTPKPGAWYPEELLTLDQVATTLGHAGIQITTL
jgi:NAD(P)-dependent dehydrogenase (short-subunit alcohol dehydrogenase family)